MDAGIIIKGKNNMGTITVPSRMMRIRDELKTLSPQELHVVETMARDFQQDRNAEPSDKKDIDADLEFDEDGWLRPKPEHVQEFMENWRGCLKGMTEDDYYQMKYERMKKTHEK